MVDSFSDTSCVAKRRFVRCLKIKSIDWARRLIGDIANLGPKPWPVAFHLLVTLFLFSFFGSNYQLL